MSDRHSSIRVSPLDVTYVPSDDRRISSSASEVRCALRCPVDPSSSVTWEQPRSSRYTATAVFHAATTEHSGRSRVYDQDCSPDRGSRPITDPPSAVTTEDPVTTGSDACTTSVAPLGARHSSVSVAGTDGAGSA